MSIQDIKDSYSIIKIKDTEYKVAYDMQAIIDLEEVYETPFMELGTILDNFNKKSIKDLVDFCFIGFKKYQPDVNKEIIDDIESYTQLIDICYNEFLRKIVAPDVFKDLVHVAQEQEECKKKQTPLQRLTYFFLQKLNLTIQK